MSDFESGRIRETQMFDMIGPDVTGQGQEFVGTLHATQSRSVNEANAQLIAAAPELLSALKLCLYTLRQMLSDGHFHHIGAEHEIENATNAINKAEGKLFNLTYEDIAPTTPQPY